MSQEVLDNCIYFHFSQLYILEIEGWYNFFYPLTISARLFNRWKLSIGTVTSAITAMIQFANQSAVFLRIWEIVYFSYFLFVKIKAFQLIGTIWDFVLQWIEYTFFLLATASWNIVLFSIQWWFVNFARYLVLIKPIKILLLIFHIL